MSPRIPLSRRAVLAGGVAAALARPYVAAAQTGDVEVAIVGGGAAGIAAARKLGAAGRSYVLIEAAPRLGGRAHTETVFDLPFDLGAGRFARAGNPLVEAATESGLPLSPLRPGRRLYVDGREAGDSEYESFAAALGRAERTITATADAGRDVAAARALPDLGEWSATVNAVLGPLGCGRALSAVSTVDLARRAAPADDMRATAGVGALLGSLGAWLNTRLGTRVSRIDTIARGVALEASGTLRARTVILAVPAAVLAAGAIRITPGLPQRLQGALGRLPSGLIENVGFVLPGNPLGLSSNELVQIKAGTAAPALLQARIGGSDLHVAVFGGEAAGNIASKGEAAALDRTRNFLVNGFGRGAVSNLTKVVASRWSADPLIRGALAVAEPGAGGVRGTFADPVSGRLIFAGEYTHETLWGTLAGAWLSGERAADQAIRILGGRA
ncbi:MAG TPA: FAD-dependent oxidoreductase [Xanthobacteraceae bacterium]|nr:FAD-dependent oxidoreductase [Xanthobacteraceae bacterium]